VLILPPGHAKTLALPRRFSLREKWIVGSVLAAAAALVVVVVISLGSTGHRTANGCVDVKFPIAIGGEEIYECGTAARELCATVVATPASNAVEDRAIAAQCRVAGLPLGRAR
jgi:hypothetical protein